MTHPRYFKDIQKLCIFERQRGQCGYCACSMTDEADSGFYHHVLRHHDGGATNLENGVLLCGGCHLFVHAGNTKIEVTMPRVKFKYANWEENPIYKLHLNQRGQSQCQ
ncbi:MAG: hypothetical protein GQ569_05890 [Methylococcaceae bacterium]|nr:hypothetical protein [Methylococcaceae bacterium]